MTKTFTQNDLIRFIYQETTEEEAQEIKRVLSFDPELQRHYRELMLSKTEMDNAQLEPSTMVVANILCYAHGWEVNQ